MSSNLYKRKDSPYWWFRLPAIRGESRPLQRSTGTTDKRKAQELLDKLKAERWELDKLGVKPDYLWEDAAGRWLREKVDKKTYRDDVSKLRILRPYLDGRRLKDIDRDLIDRIKYERAQVSTKASANRYLALVRGILRKARDDWEMVNKVPSVTLFKEPSGRVRSLTLEEFARLHQELPEHLAEMALFSVATGLRQGNMKRLQWGKVNESLAVAWVDADEHKNGHAHSVPLNAVALSVLARQRGKHTQYVFTYNGQPIGQVRTRAWEAALKRAEIEDFRWHDLRHTWATWQREQGTPTYELQRLGGWRSQAMVERYAHVGQPMLAHAAKRLDNSLSEYISTTRK